MKKITLFLFALFSCWQISAQVSSYGFSHFLGSYIENSASATAIPGVRADTFISTAQNIGFDFVYDGVTYTQFKMSSNGIISFNMTGTNSLTGNDLSTDNPTSRPIIAPLWDDLDGANPASSLASYEVTGSAPNRVLTVEWRNWEWNYASSTPVISFQVKLHETTNVIEFVYRQEATNVNSGSATIGIGSPTGSGAGSFLSLSSVASPTVSSTTSTNNINTKPATGQIYRFTPPSCFAPNSLAVSNISTSSATISWNGVSPAPSNGYEYYYSDVNTAPTGAGTPINALTANLAGLNAATTYYVWLRSDCGGTFSAWNGPYSFRTLCDAFSIPFTETFDSTSSTEACWTVLNVNADADAWNLSYATTPITGNQSAMIYTDGGNGTNDDWLITPKITLNGNQRLLFKYKVQSSTEPNDFRIMLSTTGTAPADFTTTLMPLTAFSNTTAETRVISLSGISGDVYIGYHVPAGGLDGWRLYIDDVTVEDIPVVAPTCSTITSPVNGALNVTNTRVSWSTSLDATGYKISVGYQSGATDVLNMFDVGNVTSYVVPTDPGTTYFVTVYPYNSFGTATGCSEISFTTCDEIGDFSENFDSLTATGQIPSCWNRVLTNISGATIGTSTTTPSSAPYSIALANSSSTAAANIMLVTPALNNLSAGTNRLRFSARNTTATQDIEVGTMTNPDDPSTFTVIQAVDLGTTFQDYSVSFASYTGTNKYIAIRRLSTSTFTTVYIDNVVWEPIPAVVPTCVAITSPTDQAINVTNSRVTWSTSLDATGYKISVGYQSGATDVLNMFDVGNVTSYVIPTDPGTTYFVTVYPYNSFGTATGCSEISFTTCDALFPDVTETFATFLPSCWLNMTGGDLVTGPTSTTGSGWVADGFANNGTTGAVRNEIWTTGANDWLISPLVTIPASGYELRFDAAATQYASSNAPTTAWETDDFIQVLVSTGFNNWTVLFTYDSTNQPMNTATPNVIDLDAYAGMDVRFAFRAVEGTANGNADIDFFIDNFNVRLTPASAPSCATNIVATPNATCGNFATVITWDAAVSADGYNIAIGTTPGTGNVFSGNLGNVLTYSFIGNIGTTYYYTIVPYNASGSATGCTEQSFTTNASGCYCVSAPTSVDGTGITNVQLVATNFANTVSTSPVYNDHTATVVDMSQGISNSVQITFNTDSFGTSYDYNTVIWIDVNDNFTFEPSEIVFTGVSAAVSPTILNASFVMPGTAPLGQHRMRIVATDALQTPANPCYSGTFGETVDFIINVVAAPACLPPTNLSVGNITATSANLIWTESGTATSWDIEWGTLGFTPTGTPTISGATNPQSISGLSSNTTYSFYVRSNCGAGGYSTWSGPFSFTTSCVADNVPYSQDFETATTPNLPSCTSQQNVGSGNLWTVVNDDIDYGFMTKALRYRYNGSNAANVWFYTNGINLTAGTTYRVSYSYGGTALYPEKLKVAYGTAPLASAMTTVLADYPNVINDTPNDVFVDFTPTASGVYYFGFNAYSIANQFYLFVDNIVVDVALSNTDFDNSNFMAYPNPVKDVLNVSYSTEISSIRVINMIGQEVISRNVNASSTQVDMSELSAGTYIVNVTLGDAVKTLKVVKQ